MTKYSLFVLLLIASSSAHATNGFSKTKKVMYKQIFNNAGTTFYCGCKWKNRQVDLTSCGLQGYYPKKYKKRAQRTEAEHIIPASWMLKVNKKLRQCAIDAKKHKSSKRNYCRKYDQDYKKAHNDLVNLWPAVGQINANRSNKPFVDEVIRIKEDYRKCESISGSKGFVPPNNKKGDIARIAFYMGKTYGATYSKRQNILFNQWNINDPITIDEKKHHDRIIKIQGYGLKL